MRDVLDRLRGGDLRSLGAADEVAAAAIDDGALIPLLVNGMIAEEPVVRMRCADALEKATRDHPKRLRPHASHLLALLDPSQPKEVLWHVLQMTPRVRWRAAQKDVVLLAVEGCLGSSSAIVKTCAMQALAELARQQWPQELGRVVRMLQELSRSGTAAMRARGAKLLRGLEGSERVG